jgi:hypothetical protein
MVLTIGIDSGAKEKTISFLFRKTPTYLHDLSKYVSKLKTNLCNQLSCVFQQNQKTNVYLQFLCEKLGTKRKIPQQKGDPKKLSCLNKQTICH